MDSSVKPTAECMLASKGSEKDLRRPNTAGEKKLDGTRIWAGKAKGAPFVINRKNVDYTDRLPEIVAALNEIPSDDFTIDAEACVYENGRTIFTLSQRRCSTLDPGKQAEYRLKYPLVIETFDIVYLDGEDLRNHTWQSRRRVLEKLLKDPKQSFIRPTVVVYTVEDKLKMWDDVVARGAEGMMVKALHSPYLGDAEGKKRTRFWLKVKKWNQERCRVVGYTAPTPGGKRDGFFGSLMLAKPDDLGRLVYCGKVGTGFSDAEVKHIFNLLREVEIETGLVRARDSNNKAIRYTPVDISLEVTVKFQETTPRGVFRIPSMVKDKHKKNLIHYNSSTVQGHPGQQTDLRALLEKIAKKGKYEVVLR
ncbi:hypothetical protein LCGC14_0688050 [marine sediment metagenome]|uniref:ATP-dependent DNA ligase family profile domain-containing protein n=1 Tax=marine sediment metagenome TaxID=412755 RepID=A0A0F9R6K9_9ZZZZ